MKKAVLFLFMVLISLQLLAEIGYGFVVVYKTNGTVDSIPVNGVYSITHSRYDQSGTEHPDYVSMVINTTDAKQVYHISDILYVMSPEPPKEPITLSGELVRRSAPKKLFPTGKFPAKTANDKAVYKWEEMDSLYVHMGTQDTSYHTKLESMTTSDSTRARFETVRVRHKEEPIQVYYPGKNAPAYNKVRIAREQTQMVVNDTKHIDYSGDCATDVGEHVMDDIYTFTLNHHPTYFTFLSHSDRLPSVKVKSVTLISTNNKPMSGTFTFDHVNGIDLNSVEDDKNDTVTLYTKFFEEPIGWKHTPRIYENSQDSTAAYMVVAPQQDVEFKFQFNVIDTLSLIDTTFVKSYHMNLKPNTFYTVNVNVPDTLFSIVDLGLGDIKYAFRNVEAYFERGPVANYGGAFAYGESNTKNDYDPGWQNQNMRWGLIDQEFTPNWDAAYQRWGGCWRLQQTLEADSLLSKCSFEWREYNGVEGVLVTGPSGRRIFLPANDNCSRYWAVNRDYTTSDLYYYIPNSGGALGYYKIPGLALDKDRSTPLYNEASQFYNPGFARGVIEYSNYLKSNTPYDGSLMLLRHKYEQEVTGTDRFAIVGMVRSARPWPSENTSVQLQETGFIFGTDSATLYFDPADEVHNKEWRDEDSLFVKTDWRPVDGNHLKLNGGSKSVGAYAANEQDIRVELKGADFLGFLDKEKKYYVREYFRVLNTETGEYDYYYASRATQIQGFFPHTDNIRWQVGDETATLNAHIVGVSAEVVGKVGFVVTDRLKNENEYEEPTIYNGELWFSDPLVEGGDSGMVNTDMTFSHVIPKAKLRNDRYYFVRGVFVSFSEEDGVRDTTCLYAPEVKILHPLDTVDYQMSFKAANINVGAQYPEDRDSTYVWNNGPAVDPLITDIAGTEHDVVFRKWFGREGWCFTLPTVAQAQAMLDTLTFVSPNDKKRFGLDVKRVTGINDEKGYLPYTDGSYQDYANYWTSQRNGISGQASYVDYLGGVNQTTTTNKLWVRPVLQTNCRTLDGEIMFISTDTVGRRYVDEENSVISFYGRQLGITPAMKGKYTTIERGFVLHDFKGGTMDDVPCAVMPDPIDKAEIFNGLYTVTLPDEVRDTIRADREYWYRAYIKVDNQEYYGIPKKIAPLTISIDSIGWEVHENKATLFSYVDGVEFVKDREHAQVGYVVGDSANIDLSRFETQWEYDMTGKTLNNTRVNAETHQKTPRYETVMNVPKDTVYWVRAYITADGMTRYSEARQFGLDYVDLGVKDSKGQTLLWANIDVGSGYPEDNPDYYALGESATKLWYDEKTYIDDTVKYVREPLAGGGRTDHVTQSQLKTVNLTVASVHGSDYTVPFRGAEHQKYNCEGPLYWKGYAGTKNDAAYVNWGNDNPKFTDTNQYIENTKYGNLFVEPDQDEWEALRQCSWKAETVFDVPGWRVTGPNGNSIFLPLKGQKGGSEYIKDHQLEWRTDTAHFHSAGFFHVSDGYQSTDSLKMVSVNYSQQQFFDTPSTYDDWTLTWGEFYNGFQVRPIARYNLRLTKGAEKLRDDTLAYLATDTCYMLNYRTAVALQGSYRINYPMATNTVGFVVGNSHDVTVASSPLVNHEATLKNNSQYFLVLDHEDGLESDKTYYYRFYLKVGEVYYYADADTFHLADQVTGPETRWQMYSNQAHVTGTVQGVLKNEAQSAGFKAGIIISKNRNLKADDSDLTTDFDLTGSLNDYNGSKGGPISHDFTLAEEAIYYFRTYVYYNGAYHYGDVNTFGYELLDLGLPSGKRWAAINTGGNSPLNGRSIGPTVDNHGVNNNMPYGSGGNGSGGLNDTSHQLWHNVYRQPYSSEARELIDNCTWELDTLWGCAGMTGTGPNGKKIFIRRNRQYYQFQDNYTDLSINHEYIRISDNSTKPSVGYLSYHSHGCQGVDYSRAIWESSHTLPNSGQDEILIRTDDAIVHPNVDYVSFFGSLIGTTQQRWNGEPYTVPGVEHAGFVIGSDTLTTHLGGTGADYFKYDLPHTDVKKDSVYWYDRQNINLFKVDSTYWVRAYVKIDGNYYYGRSIKFVRQPNIITGDVEWQVGEQQATLHGSVTGFNGDYMLNHQDEESTILQDMEELTKSARMGIIVGYKHDIVAADTLTDAHAKLYYYMKDGEPRAENGAFQMTVPYERDTTYYYRAFIYYNGEYLYGKTGRYGLEFRDLGFNSGMYWASINVGSRYAEDRSNQYAWGETSPRSQFRFEDYVYYYSTGDDEYNNLGNEIKGSQYDVAHDKWDYTWDEAEFGGRGALWSMPSEDDLQMLVDSCEWRDSVSYKYVPNSSGGSYVNVEGYKVTSKKNGNWIFITKDQCAVWTMSGFHSDRDGPWDRSPLWTSSRAPRDRNAFGMQAGTTNRLMKYHYRYHGHYVRPIAYINVVLDNGHKLSLTTERTSWVAGVDNASIYGCILGLNNSVKATYGFVVGQSPDNLTVGASGVDTYTVQTNSNVNGLFSKNFSTLDNNRMYYYRVFAQVGGKYYYGNVRDFGIVMVDLGLSSGTKWANVNMGAWRTKDHGDYYGWGETTTKDIFTLTGYKYYDNVNQTYRDLSTNISGNDTTDVANKFLHGQWRMASDVEWDELRTECTWTHEVIGHIPGYRVTGRNGNSIFLPSNYYTVDERDANYDYSTNEEGGNNMVNHDDEVTHLGYYWSSNRSGDFRQAREFTFDASEDTRYQSVTGTLDNQRWRGNAIRAVARPLNATVPFYFRTESTDWRYQRDSVNFYSAVLELPAGYETGFLIGSSAEITKDNALRTIAARPLKDGSGNYYGYVKNNEYRDGIYYYRGYVKSPSGEYTYADSKQFGLLGVDLGVEGLQWANINVDAASPEEMGLHGVLTAPYSEADPAYVEFGGLWRTPTEAEKQAIVEGCDWTQVDLYATKVWKVSNKTDATKFIYLTSNDPTEWGYRAMMKSNLTFDDGERVYLRTDSTNWRAGYGGSTLYATLVGSQPVFDNITERGFVVGTSAAVTHATDLQQSATAEGTQIRTSDFESDIAALPVGTYYYRAFVKYKDKYYYAENALPTGIEFVDLGLPSGITWANVNIGSTVASDLGDSYAWGETATKSEYSLANYAHHTAIGYTDIGADISSNNTYDAASAKIAGARLPSQADMQELISNCSWTGETLNGVAGYRVTSRTNSNSIFLPAGLFWSSTQNVADNAQAFELKTNQTGASTVTVIVDTRWGGRMIRPVSALVTTTEASDVTTSTAQLNGYVNIADYAGAEVGFELSRSSVMANATTKTVTVSESGDYHTTATDLTEGNMYYYRAYVTTGGRTYRGAIKSFATKSSAGMKAIDLGLSVKWADRNVGAALPENIGSYYGWGELVTQRNYTAVTYNYATGNNTSATYHDIGLNISATQYDIANKTFNGCWRMPTQAEINELLGCSWTWATKEGVPGYWVENAVSHQNIFLPANGYRDNTDTLQYKTNGYYWSSIPNGSATASRAMSLTFGATSRSIGQMLRYDGLMIRPVYDTNGKVGEQDIFIRTDSVSYAADRTQNTLYGMMLGLNSAEDGLTQGFVIGTTANVTTETTVVSGLSQTATANGSYHVTMTDEQLRSLTIGDVYYVRAYVSDGEDTKYGEAVEMTDYTFFTDHVEWGLGNAGLLYGHVKGVKPVAGLEVGYIYSNKSDMTDSHSVVATFDATDNTVFIGQIDTIKVATYYYQAYTKYEGVVHKGAVKSFGAKVVDLGLPSGVKWVDMNLGSDNEEEAGDHYRWGETLPEQSGTYTVPSTIDAIGGTVNDAVHTRLGSAYRIASVSNIDELLNECSWAFDVNGYRVTGKNGNSIFIPVGDYWSSQRGADGSSTTATALRADDGNTKTKAVVNRSELLLLRPTVNPHADVAGEGGNAGSGSIGGGVEGNE